MELLEICAIIIIICAGVILYEAWKRDRWIKELHKDSQRKNRQ